MLVLISLSKLTAKSLIAKKVPYVLIPGILLAVALGFKGTKLDKIEDYSQIKEIFPSSGVVETVEDGDTFTLDSGVKVRLIGVDSPDRGQKNYLESKSGLEKLIKDKKVFLEYDRYQDDKFGRILSWVWINCEDTPEFLPADYMHKSGNESNVGLTQNPKGCQKGKLIQEELLKSGLTEVVNYSSRGPTKYERLINPK